MSYKSSICRITVGGENGFRGTGALVSDDGLVLTAFHVIGDLEKSKGRPAAVFYDRPLKIVFGDPDQGPGGTWIVGDGRAVWVKYSVAEDWALLRLQPRDNEKLVLGAPPLVLSKPIKPGAPFTTYGFPKYAPVNGHELAGMLGQLADRKIQLLVDNMPVGQSMGGISGAPVIDQTTGHIAGVIQQQLADEKNVSVAATLYMLPIGDAIASFPGLLAWDDGGQVQFQGVVEANLPPEEASLDLAGDRLGLPEAERKRRPIARRMLASDVERVGNALVDIPLEAKRAETLLDCVAAMSIHPDAVKAIQVAQAELRVPWIEAGSKRIHWWCVKRAFDNERPDPRRIVLLRMQPGCEESPREANEQAKTLAVDEAETAAVKAAVDEIVARVDAVLRRRFQPSSLVDNMVCKVADPAKAARHQFWLVLVGERRPKVVDALRKRLPNARVVIGLVERSTCPEDWLSRLAPAAPVVLASSEHDLIEAWGSSATKLDLHPDPEDDET